MAFHTEANVKYRVHEMPSGGIFPEGISPKGVSGKHLDLLQKRSQTRLGHMESEALCFSGDSLNLYHVTKDRSDKHPGNWEFRIKVAIWNVKESGPSVDVPLTKQVRNSLSRF